MGKLYYLMGKSAAGKNEIYEALMNMPELKLKPLVIYTTRPIRCGETDGVDYYFTDEEGLQKLQSQGRVIELRTYHTVHGDWNYFTVDDGHADLDHQNYLGIGTLESYIAIRNYLGSGRVIPLYIETEDGGRLERALKRERKQAHPEYEEMCRRFLADQKDFSEENLAHAGITRRYSNEGPRENCIREIADMIRQSE